jgi:hypothetical protein
VCELIEKHATTFIPVVLKVGGWCTSHATPMSPSVHPFIRSHKPTHTDAHVAPLRILFLLPLCVQRLKEKDEEWKRARLELSKGWKEELEKNYPKSLDHRSFYFKQADKKTVSAKALVLQMKAQVEEAQKKSEPNPRVEVRV